MRRLRLERGLTQEQFADLSGFAQQYLSGLEQGQRNPTIVTLFEIAQALGVSHVELTEIDAEFERELKVRSRSRAPARHKNRTAPERKRAAAAKRRSRK